MDYKSRIAGMLPKINMAGTEFFVDIRLNEFREVNAPWNRISMDEIREASDSDTTGIIFDKNTKNVYCEIVDPDNMPEHVTLVIIPPLMELDPVGLARKYGLPDDEHIKGKAENQHQEKQQKKSQKLRRGHRL